MSPLLFDALKKHNRIPQSARWPSGQRCQLATVATRVRSQRKDCCFELNFFRFKIKIFLIGSLMLMGFEKKFHRDADGCRKVVRLKWM